MSPVDKKVLEQTLLFRAALPGLLEEHRGEWVVFHEGSVRSMHATIREAYAAAINELGPDAGFVVAPIEEVRPSPIYTGVIFSMNSLT